MAKTILIVDDNAYIHRELCKLFKREEDFEICGEAENGKEAIEKALELRPDLIVLDIGLPSLNGIEAARRIRKLSPESRILFLSQELSADVVQEALSAGARGYVVKIDAGSELLEAVETVLRGGQFVGRRFAGHDFS